MKHTESSSNIGQGLEEAFPNPIYMSAKTMGGIGIPRKGAKRAHMTASRPLHRDSGFYPYYTCIVTRAAAAALSHYTYRALPVCEKRDDSCLFAAFVTLVNEQCHKRHEPWSIRICTLLIQF
eukprot:scaffold122206_cov38-Prasinocladus_malaysianus.AAC.1